MKLEEENNLKCFQIKPIVNILNGLSVPVSFGLKVCDIHLYYIYILFQLYNFALKDSQFLVEAGSNEDLYEYNPANFTLKVSIQREYNEFQIVFNI